MGFVLNRNDGAFMKQWLTQDEMALVRAIEGVDVRHAALIVFRFSRQEQNQTSLFHGRELHCLLWPH